jgi:hypothetical protein
MEANSWVGPQTTLEKNLVDFCEPFFGASAAFLANLKKGYNEARRGFVNLHKFLALKLKG